MNVSKVDVAADFGARLYGRYPEDGEFCGENFRTKILIPKLQSGGKVELDFTKVIATPSSFFEEAFGGLLREVFASKELASNLNIEIAQLGSPKNVAEELLSRIKLKADDVFVDKKLQKVKNYMNIAADLIAAK